MEKEIRRMRFVDTCETEGEIFKILKENPVWHTKEQIIPKLPDWCSDYIEDAFTGITDRDEFVEVKQNPDGTQLYKWYPDEDE